MIVAKSTDAGFGVCSQSLHHSIQYFEKQKKPTQCIFLHLKDPIAKPITKENKKGELVPVGYEDVTTKQERAYEELSNTYATGLKDVLSNLDKIFDLSQAKENRR